MNGCGWIFFPEHEVWNGIRRATEARAEREGDIDDGGKSTSRLSVNTIIMIIINL